MKKTALAALMLAASTTAMGQYSHSVNADNLGRGVLAVHAADGVFISWRSLPGDDKALAFDVYRDGVKVNSTPLSKKTNFTDSQGTVDSKYTVKAVLDGKEIESSEAPAVWANDYMKIHLDRPEGGTCLPGAPKNSVNIPILPMMYLSEMWTVMANTNIS